MFIGLVSPKIISKVSKKEFTRKKVLLTFGGTALVSMIIASAIFPSNPPVKTDSVQTKEIIKTEESKIEESTQTKLKKIADKIINKQGSVEIEFDQKDGTATLTYSKDQFYSEETVIKTGYTYLIKFGKEAFNLSEIKAILIVVKTNFTDQYGKSTMEPGVSVEMTKEEFQKFDWDGLKYQSLYDTFVKSASFHYINPVLLKTIDTSKLYYNEGL